MYVCMYNISAETSVDPISSYDTTNMGNWTTGVAGRKHSMRPPAFLVADLPVADN